MIAKATTNEIDNRWTTFHCAMRFLKNAYSKSASNKYDVLLQYFGTNLITSAHAFIFQ